MSLSKSEDEGSSPYMRANNGFIVKWIITLCYERSISGSSPDEATKTNVMRTFNDLEFNILDNHVKTNCINPIDTTKELTNLVSQEQNIEKFELFKKKEGDSFNVWDIQMISEIRKNKSDIANAILQTVNFDNIINLNAGEFIHLHIDHKNKDSKILLGTNKDGTAPYEPVLLGGQTHDFLLDLLNLRRCRILLLRLPNEYAVTL